MQNKQQSIINTWLQRASIEIMPHSQLSDHQLTELLIPNQKVYITFMADTNIQQMIDMAQRLQKAGATPVAHIPARHLQSSQQLHDYVSQLQDNNIKHVLLLAGGTTQTLGPYEDSLQLLETGLFDGDAFETIGFAAHPDGHPQADAAALQKALHHKTEWAQQQPSSAYFITQFVFEAKPILNWLQHYNNANMLPVDIGLPGITQTKTLLRFASIAGISWQQLVGMILRQPWQWLKFLTQWSPRPIIETLAEYHHQHDESPIAGLHFYTFGGFARTAQWLTSFETASKE